MWIEYYGTKMKSMFNDIFAYNVALDVINDNKDHEPMSIKECIQKDDSLKWKKCN